MNFKTTIQRLLAFVPEFDRPGTVLTGLEYLVSVFSLFCEKMNREDIILTIRKTVFVGLTGKSESDFIADNLKYCKPRFGCAHWDGLEPGVLADLTDGRYFLKPGFVYYVADSSQAIKQSEILRLMYHFIVLHLNRAIEGKCHPYVTFPIGLWNKMTPRWQKDYRPDAISDYDLSNPDYWSKLVGDSIVGAFRSVSVTQAMIVRNRLACYRPGKSKYATPADAVDDFRKRYNLSVSKMNDILAEMRKHPDMSAAGIVLCRIFKKQRTIGFANE